MNNLEKGSYFVIEGIDGSGKTTQSALFTNAMRALNYDVEVIAEPGGTEIGDSIRKILKDSSLERTPESNFDLFNICRREIVAQKIGPAVLAGKVVISDRNWLSSVAYQGFGEGMDVDNIISKTKNTLGEYFVPSDLVVLDMSIEIAEERIKSRGESASDYFEQKGSLFFERVLEGYRWLANKYDFKIVDGNNTVEEVKQDIDLALNL